MEGLQKKIAKSVDKIINDISGRQYIGDEWEGIDEDIQDEIRSTWHNIISDTIKE